MKKLLLGVIASTLSLSALASTIGISNQPFVMNKHIISTEFNSFMSNGTGAGIGIKYTQKYSDNLNFDIGAAFTNGDRASRISAGADFSIIPDYGRQPKVSVKGLLISESIDGDRINSFGAAPTISKGLVFWGNEAYPYAALPITVNLNNDTNEFETATALATGITGRLGQTNGLVGNIEANFNLQNSYTALIMGVSLPIQ